MASVALLTALAAIAAATASAAVTQSTQHHVAFDGLDPLISASDLIQGLSEEPFNFGDPGVYTNPGDLGWHPANTNPAHHLPVFTDGLGGFADFAGLLNENFQVGGDMPLSGAPVKVIEYVLAEPSDVGAINILSGNRLNSDGRAFMSVSILYSTDDGGSFHELGYFQSDPSGTVNSEINPVPPLSPAAASTLVRIFDDASDTLLAGVTNLEFSFYAVDNDTLGRMADPFTGVNTFTDEDDGLDAAFVSPLIWEIDVLPPSEGIVGDYNRDNVVDAADYTVWRDNLGATVTPGAGADGSGNGLIDQSDYNEWRSHYGAGAALSAAGAPEPGAAAMLLLSSAPLLARRLRPSALALTKGL